MIPIIVKAPSAPTDTKSVTKVDGLQKKNPLFEMFFFPRYFWEIDGKKEIVLNSFQQRGIEQTPLVVHRFQYQLSHPTAN